MCPKHLLLFQFSLLLSGMLTAQVSGTISDQNGKALPFANVYVKGSSAGTTSNSQGAYTLHLSDGNYDLVFQYMGFKQQTLKVSLSGQPCELNVQLQPEAIGLEEVVVKAGAEDPAYAVIRKAIDRRKFYQEQVKQFSCDVYVKGTIKFLDVPEKFMGQELGTLGGSLDSNRQGIIYLSESRSTLHFKAPNHFKEVLLHTKVSGNDQGLGFNRAAQLEFNLYNNFATFGRQIVSPIANNALHYYSYKLLGTFYDQEGRLLNKIQVIPKRAEDPVYRGTIYILEDLWAIQSVDLRLLAGSMKQPGLDTIYIKQLHLPVGATDLWRIFSQSVQLRFGLFGFKAGADFSLVYSDYDLAPNFGKGFFNNELFRLQDNALKQNRIFWDSLRPIPLTLEEKLDYFKRDSLQQLRSAGAYRDSLDKANNKFHPSDLILGYYGANSSKGKVFGISSPLVGTNFNTIQGFNVETLGSFRKYYNEYLTRWLSVDAKLNYGISDREFRGFLGATFQFNQKNRMRIRAITGRDAFQFNPENPFSPVYNSYTSLVFRENYMKIYNKTFGRMEFSGELTNGIYLQSSLEYAERRALINRNDFSFFGDPEDSPYTSNNPIEPSATAPFFETHQSFILNLSLRFRYKQKYSSLPGRKVINGSAFPDFWIDYERGFPGFNSAVNYHKIAARVHEKYLPFGVFGFLEFRLEAGTFFKKNEIYFIDFKHFDSNLPSFNFTERFSYTFLKLPYYQYSTASPFFQAHFQQHFEGFLLDKIPGIRSLGLYTLLGASILYTRDRKEYVELSIGLDNIGIGPFRLITVNAVLNKSHNSSWNLGASIGLRLPTQG